jgi:hypothetical protein
MKGKLSKSDIQYRLHNEEGIIIATSYDGKLSKQNCDEIFGIIDVELMADFYGASVKGSLDFKFGANKGFEDGFNKAMGLNKDKLFTVEDMQKLMYATIDLLEQDEGVPLKFFKEFLQSLQQPTEIDVEIEIEYIGECNGNNGDGCFQDSPVHNCGCFQRISKLDSNRCLILKKI